MAEIGRELFEKHLPIIDAAVDRLARRWGLSAQTAADFRQAVRLRFLDGDGAVLRRFDGRSTLKTYVAAVTGRAWCDFRAGEPSLSGRWRPLAEENGEGENPAPFPNPAGGPDPEARLAGVQSAGAEKELLEALIDGVSRLSPQERLVLKLRFVDGLKWNEVAVALGQPQRAFYREKERLLAALRREVERRMPQEAGARRQLLALVRAGWE